jgi:acyl carrier protein
MCEVERIVREGFARVLNEPELQPGRIDIDREMSDYGLTSLNKILLITSVCDEAQVDLFHFTEHDLARMRTPRDVIEALNRVATEVQ